MAGKVAKETQKLVDQAVAQGWTVRETKKGLMLCPPDKSMCAVTVHGTESDVRALRNTRAQMKRCGFKDEG